MTPITQLDDAARHLNCLAALVPHDRRVEFWRKITSFCEGPAWLAGEESEQPDLTQPVPPSKLDEIERLVANLKHPGPWPSDISGMCGGNYDDAFLQGVNHGEGILAKQIQDILDA